MKTFIRRYRWHPLLWILFAAYEIISLYTVHGIVANMENYVVHYFINISLAYVLSSWILPYSVGGNNRRIFVLCISLAFLMMLFLTASNLADRLLDSISDADFFGTGGLDEIFIAVTIWRGIHFMGIGSTIFLFENRINMLKQSADMQKKASESEMQKSNLALELANARNAYLQAQINPHFMLSSLSYIYDNTRKLAPSISETVRYLSKLLRYALSSERGPKKIDINIEIEQVENLLRITQFKKKDSYILFHCKDECRRAKLIPFVLLSLVENMLKHGDLSNQEEPGTIKIFKSEAVLIIETTNRKSDGVNDTGLHTGLSNLRQRLVNIYGDHGVIQYVTSVEAFRTRVSLPFEECLSQDGE